MNRIAALLAGVRVLPILTLTDATEAVPLCTALAAGGLQAVEITLRTAAALGAIAAVRAALPNLVVAAGTVLTADDLAAAQQAGAHFAVSPGLTATLAHAAAERGLPLLPGVASASDVMRGMELGLTRFKLFPAVPVGGIALLQALAGPLPQAQFCPTGGISRSNAGDFLALPNVFCVGGSWLAPAALLARRDWSAVTALARDATRV